MIADDPFERLVSDWLHDDASDRVPDHLDAVLRLTRSARQRSAWSSHERWLHVDMTFRPRAFNTPRPSQVLLVATLILVFLGALFLYAGSRQQRLPAPFGPADLGRMAYASGGDIYLRASGSAEGRRITSGPEWDSYPGFSPDGTRFGFLRSASAVPLDAVVMVGDADGNSSQAVSEPILGIASGDWSGDGRYLAFAAANVATPDADDFVIKIVDIDQRTTATVDVGMSVESVRWTPPLGQQLMFRGLTASMPTGVWTVRPDGTGLRELGPHEGFPGEAFQNPSLSADGGLLGYNSWSREELKMHTYIRNLRDGSIRGVANPAARSDMSMVQFSPDQRLVLVMNQRRDGDPPDFGGVLQLAMASVDGGDVTFVGPEYSFETVETIPDLSATFTVDGAAVLLLDRGQKQLWTLPVTGRPGLVERFDGEALPGMQRLASDDQTARTAAPG